MKFSMGNFIRWGFMTIVMAALIAVVFWFTHIAENNVAIQELVTQYGYAGIFVIAILSGFNLAVPIPAVSFMPLFIASGLGFYTTLGVIIVGVTLADMATFMVGKWGRRIASLRDGKIFKTLNAMFQKYYWTPLIVLVIFASVMPLPNEVIAIPLGLLGYRLLPVMLALLLGNTIFSTLATLGLLNIFNTLF